MSTIPKFRLAWRHTWPDKPADFVASDGDLEVGRIYRDAGTPSDSTRWMWCAYAELTANITLTDRGRAPSKDEAAASLERAYFATRARLG